MAVLLKDKLLKLKKSPTKRPSRAFPLPRRLDRLKHRLYYEMPSTSFHITTSAFCIEIWFNNAALVPQLMQVVLGLDLPQSRQVGAMDF